MSLTKKISFWNDYSALKISTFYNKKTTVFQTKLKCCCASGQIAYSRDDKPIPLSWRKEDR